MQLNTLLLVLAVQGLSGLRTPRGPGDKTLTVEHESTSTFSKLFGYNGQMGLAHLVNKDLNSTLKVLHTNEDGGYDLLEVFLQPLSEDDHMLLDKEDASRRRKGGGSASNLPGGFHFKPTSGTFKGGAPNFLKLLLQDLPEDKLQSLQTCGAQMSANPNDRGSGGVWLILNGEKLSAESLQSNKAFNENNVLMLGAPGKDVVAGKGRSFYVPGASLAFMAMPKHSPMDLVNRKEVAKEEGHVLGYQHHNCKASRDGFFLKMCEGLHNAGMKCHALGQCGHNQYAEVDNRNNAGGRDLADRDDRSTARMSPYKFVESFENSAGFPSTPGYSSSGYITEKIIPALLAGSVPVYAGADSVTEVFNAAALIDADANDLGGAIKQIVDLEKNPEKYKAMVTADAVTESQMKRFFTWHPATWEKYGDGLRMRIVDQLLSFCNNK